ncbi:autotransporter outer membrane beta-barrel domain-containing protein [Pseudomonas baetica]|uniref:autotransporter outer membrane beta-barrel domain-containing protein n=1 Tax=Pseudomonas baetica TaxID=674054 RepID=UPI003EED6B4E
MSGRIKNFTYINKTGLGTWTLSGVLGPNDRTGPATFDVQAGTLVLGNYYGYFTGTTLVDNGGTLKGAGDDFPKNINNNGRVQFEQVTDAAYGGVISGTGMVTKSGSGRLELTGKNTHTGGTNVDAGTLALSGAGTLGASTGITTVTGGTLDLGGTTQTQATLNQFGGTVQGGTLNLGTYQLNDGTLAADSTVNASNLFDFRSGTANGVLRGAGAVQKTTADSVTVAGAGSQVASVEVKDGTLRFEQAGAFTTTGNYTTQAGATTDLGRDHSTLAVGGVFTQAANATLKVTLDATRPVIRADSARLDGLFTFDGFSPNATLPVKASEVTQRVYTLIQTTNGVTGDFTNGQNANTDLDYLLRGAHISADGKDYNLGFRMAWTDGGQAQGTGNFTVKDDTAFQVDTVLADQSAPAGGFASGWDGKSLNKSGGGLLELSAANTYTGGTTVDAGTLALTGAGTLGASTGTTTVSGGTLDLGGTAQTQTALKQFGGTVQSGTLNLGTYQLSGGTLAADTTVNASGLFDFRAGTANGVLHGGALQKTTADSVTVAGAGSQVASVEVQGGTLRFEQTDAFTTTGNYTTQAGATTDLGRDHSTLAVGGVFTQAANATLKVTLDATRPVIKADSASLDGLFTFDGFSPNATSAVKASEVTQRLYTLIQATNGVTGDFTNSQNAQTGLDYLLRDGHISADGKNYNIGFRMAWNDGGQTQGTGDFTVKDDTAFQIDTILADQSLPAGGFASGWDGKSLSKSGGGLLVLSAANTYTGSTTLNGGTLRTDVADSFASSSDVIVNDGVLDLNGNDQTANRLAGTGGEIRLNGATLTANNSTTADNTAYGGDITDGTKAGSLIKTGDGTLTLTGQTGWTGITELRGGELVLDGIDGGAQLTSNIIGTRGTRLTLQNGASLTGWIDPTDVKIDSTSIWRMTDSSLVDNVDLAGAIQFVEPTTLPLSQGRTLTASNWVGRGGTVELYTVLGDDRSVSDRIVIDGGRATGTTGLIIRHAGGNGAQTDQGIRVVETRNGATTETDAFSLAPTSDGYRAGTGTIAAGAYDYYLVRGGNNGVADDWYLSSVDCVNDRSLCEQPDTPMPSQRFRPEVGSYLNNKEAASTMLIHTLHDRQFSAQSDDESTSGDTNGWLRVVNKSSDRTGAGRQDLSDTISLIHGGGDLLHFSDGADGSVRVGAMGAYGTSDNRADNGSLSSHGSVNGYSVGVYGTWFGHQDTRSGPYVDSWLMYGKFDNQVKGQGLESEDYRSSNLSASLETGYSIAIHESKDTKLYIEPQAQVINSKYRANSHTEHTGTVVSGQVDTTLTTRLGVRLHGDLGGVSGIEPIAEVNWWHGPSSQAIEFDGMKVHDALPEDRLEAKVGLQGNLSTAVSVWGQVGIESGEHDYTASKFQVGVKYAW